MSIQLYATIDDLNNFAGDLGLAEWSYLSSNGQDQTRIKQRIMVLATEDVERTLGIPRPTPLVLPYRGSQILRQAALYQAGSIIPTLDLDDLRRRISAVTNNNWSDGIVSVSSVAANRPLHPIAKALIQQFQVSSNNGGVRGIYALDFIRG